MANLTQSILYKEIKNKLEESGYNHTVFYQSETENELPSVRFIINADESRTDLERIVLNSLAYNPNAIGVTLAFHNRQNIHTIYPSKDKINSSCDKFADKIIDLLKS